MKFKVGDRVIISAAQGFTLRGKIAHVLDTSTPLYLFQHEIDDMLAWQEETSLSLDPIYDTPLMKALRE